MLHPNDPAVQAYLDKVAKDLHDKIAKGMMKGELEDLGCGFSGAMFCWDEVATTNAPAVPPDAWKLAAQNALVEMEKAFKAAPDPALAEPFYDPDKWPMTSYPGWTAQCVKEPIVVTAMKFGPPVFNLNPEGWDDSTDTPEELEDDLPEWIGKEGRGRLARSMALAADCFAFSIGSLARYHRIGPWRIAHGWHLTENSEKDVAKSAENTI